MQEFNIIKKNRKYFAATTGGYKCKVLIDKNSESLALGNHNLEVEDISVRSKYGTDLIFKLSASVEDIEDAGICTLRHGKFNSVLVKEARKLGGKYDHEEGAWVFSGIVNDEVEALDEIFNSDLITIELTFNDTFFSSQGAVEIFGYTVAKATGRDSGAITPDGIAFIKGRAGSGGSMKNWGTKIEDGSVVRLQVPALLFDKYKESGEYEDIEFSVVG